MQKTAPSDTFTKIDAFDVQFNSKTYAILRYHSKPNLLLLTLSVNRIQLVYMLIMKNYSKTLLYFET